MEINQNKISDIKKDAKEIMDYLKISENFTLENLYTEYKKVYPNINGDTNRLQIMANKHWKDNESGKMKHNSTQIYRLSKDDRKEDGFGMEEIIKIYNKVVKLCLYIEQLKLYEKIKRLEEKINNIKDREMDLKVLAELDKFFDKRKRKSIF